jgi:16S rRNA (guanine527-N7)-methyltransferase
MIGATEEDLFERYYKLVLKWNDRLHLTTITTRDAFVRRHLGESLFAEKRILPFIDEFWDIGSGVGIPGVPVAVLRPGMEVRLVEANRRKALFLEEVVAELQLKRVRVINARFETIHGFSPQACLAARAVERMERVVQEIVRKGSGVAQILILGGARLVVSAGPGWRVERHRMPQSTGRWLLELVRLSAKAQGRKEEPGN